MSQTKPTLDEATTEELVNELKDRYEVGLVAIDRAKARDIGPLFASWGDSVHLEGLGAAITRYFRRINDEYFREYPDAPE